MLYDILSQPQGYDPQIFQYYTTTTTTPTTSSTSNTNNSSNTNTTQASGTNLATTSNTTTAAVTVPTTSTSTTTTTSATTQPHMLHVQLQLLGEHIIGQQIIQKCHPSARVYHQNQPQQMVPLPMIENLL